MAYYPLSREIQQSVLWLDKPFAKGQAWVDLQLLANWAYSEMSVKGVLVHVERGQVFRSMDFLAQRWGWSIKKVRHFLGQLEDTGQVTTEGTPQGTRITIKNYPSSGVEGKTEDTVGDATKGRTEDRQKKKKIEKKSKVSSVESDMEECDAVMESYNRVCPSLPKCMKLSDKRIKAIRARFKDGFTLEDFEKAFIVAEESDFLSGRKSEWKAGFDWLLNESNLLKTLEGNYKNHIEGAQVKTTNWEALGFGGIE